MSRAVTLLVVPVAALVVACDDGATPVSPNETASASALALSSRGDFESRRRTRAIEALVAAYEAAWAAKDAAGYAALYAPDADFVAPVGDILAGRAAIQAQHAFLFAGPFAGSVSTTSIRRIEFLSGHAAIVDIDVALTGYAMLPPHGRLRETSPGVVRSRMKWLVERHRGEWEIATQQMTPVAPM
jgi:uncharacterized protein (TIGR02246 family)